MYVFDSDHLSILQRAAGREFDDLVRRCAQELAGDFFVTIISFHEQVNGWTSYVARARDARSLVRGYSQLEGILESFSRAQLLSFSDSAADVFEDLRKQRVRVGTMDLRIASIVIANQMTLLTRNTVDFERIPGLAFQDWTISPPT